MHHRRMRTRSIITCENGESPFSTAKASGSSTYRMICIDPGIRYEAGAGNNYSAALMPLDISFRDH
jgi:hypothetical protein